MTNISNKETFLQDFVVILKHLLQDYCRIYVDVIKESSIQAHPLLPITEVFQMESSTNEKFLIFVKRVNLVIAYYLVCT